MNPCDLPWILASESPRRLALLRQIGIEPVVLPARVAEVEDGDSPATLALHNAIRKASAVRPQVERGILLAADTVVLLDGVILGKPTDRDEAIEVLQKLSGRTHKVITGYRIEWIERKLRKQGTVRTSVAFRHLPTDEIERYVDSGEPYDKAGGYGIQGAAGGFVRTIHGCYFNVVGLPLARISAIVDEWIYPVKS